MFSLEMCHLLNYSFCFYFAIGPTFVLELRASYRARSKSSSETSEHSEESDIRSLTHSERDLARS